MSNEEVTQVNEVELGSQDVDVLSARIEAYTKQRDEFLQKAQTMHGELEFCQRMLQLISEESKNGTISKEE
jgi:hypothetical protein